MHFSSTFWRIFVRSGAVRHTFAHFCAFLPPPSHPGDPLHPDEGEAEDGDEGGGAHQPHVVGAVAQDAGEPRVVLRHHVQQGVAEADQVGGH